MNRYYHEFQVGFNFWMIAMVVAAIVMIVLGISQYRRVGCKVVKQFEDKGLVTISGIMTLIVGVMVTAESSAGILQWLDNHLDSKTDAAWSLIALPVVLILIAVVMWAILYGIGWLASSLGHKRAQTAASLERRRMIRMQQQPKPKRSTAYTGYYPSAQARRNRDRYERALRRQDRRYRR